MNENELLPEEEEVLSSGELYSAKMSDKAFNDSTPPPPPPEEVD